MRNLLTAGVGLVIALLIAIWCLYLIVAMVIVSGLNFLAYLVSDGWIVLVIAGIAAIVTLVVMWRAGRFQRFITGSPRADQIAERANRSEGTGHHV